ncbi:MAG TPA: hypothetical protein VGX97_02015 [bacterium]|nr:hypothetical protein [bacterium]
MCVWIPVLLAAVLAGPSSVAATAPPAPSGWAVVAEYNSYAGRYADLPAGYANSARIVTALIRRGWPPDHILLVRDSQDPAVLRHSVGWLATRAHQGDVALLYIAGEYQFFDKELMWDAALPALWKQVSTSRRVLIVETCFAERLTAAVAGIPGLGLPAVGRDELDWWGLRDTGRVVRGGSFTYFLARALESQAADTPPDFAAAFVTAVAGAQAYFHTVISTAPAALGSFHARGSYPERAAVFPNPHLVQGTGVPAAPQHATSDP